MENYYLYIPLEDLTNIVCHIITKRFKMSLKQSKTIKLLREKGVLQVISYSLHKLMKATRKCSVPIVLNFYPKCILNKSQYQIFTLAYMHFADNYKNIIAISPLFFMKNLKKHITWLESKEFQNEYGNVKDLANFHTKTLGADTITPQSNAMHNDIITPPPHLIV